MAAKKKGADGADTTTIDTESGVPPDGGTVEAAAAEAADTEAAFQARVAARLAAAGGALTPAEAAECQRAQDAHDATLAALKARSTK